MTTETASTTADTSTEGGNDASLMTEAPAAPATETSTSTQNPASATQEQKAAPEVPETYEFEMPEGVELDATAAEQFTAIAKDLKLTQEQAQKLAEVAAGIQQRGKEAHANAVVTWTEATKADKEVGGEKLQENLAVARKALDRFGTPELRDVLNASGFGNHPEFVRAFYRAGKLLSEDTVHQGRAPGAPNDMAKTMFPSMN